MLDKEEMCPSQENSWPARDVVRVCLLGTADMFVRYVNAGSRLTCRWKEQGQQWKCQLESGWSGSGRRKRCFSCAMGRCRVSWFMVRLLCLFVVYVSLHSWTTTRLRQREYSFLSGSLYRLNCTFTLKSSEWTREDAHTRGESVGAAVI